MGQETSQIRFQNSNAQFIYESFCNIANSYPLQEQKANKLSSFLQTLYNQLSKIPSNSKSIPLDFGHFNFGPIYFQFFSPKFDFHPFIKEVSFRNSRLNKTHIASIVNFLGIAVKLEKLNLSDNFFGDSCTYIFQALALHPSIISVDMRNCGTCESNFDSLFSLLEINHKIQSLLLYPAHLSSVSETQLSLLIEVNYTIKNITLSETFNDKVYPYLERNNIVNSIIYTYICPFISQQSPLFMTSSSQTTAHEVQEKLSDDEPNQHTLQYSAFDTKGKRSLMEDFTSIIESPDGCFLFSIFDGHGGPSASNFACQNLPSQILSRLQAGLSVDEAFSTSFSAIEADMKSWCTNFGTTASVALIDPEQSTLTVANCGDTRIVLGKVINNPKAHIIESNSPVNHEVVQAIRLSIDDKPETEKEWILSHGGVVINGRINGSLAVGRAFGDAFLKDAIRASPHIQTVNIGTDDKVLIIASDGLWDTLSDGEAVKIALNSKNAQEAANNLVNRALSLGSLDNISVIIVFLK